MIFSDSVGSENPGVTDHPDEWWCPADCSGILQPKRVEEKTMTTRTNVSPSMRHAPPLHAARESANRALFSAASRVLSFHAAALDAKVIRMTQGQPTDANQQRSPGAANG